MLSLLRSHRNERRGRTQADHRRGAASPRPPRERSASVTRYIRVGQVRRAQIDQETVMANRIEGRVQELLEAPNFVAVATLDKDGAPDVKVVWADHEDGIGVLNSAEGRQWPKNVR